MVACMMRLLAATLLLLAMDLPARAACPQNLSDCLGAATPFAIVAEKAILTKGILGEFGEGVTVYGASVGDTCAPRAFVGGPNDTGTQVDNLILSGADGIVGRFVSFLSGGDPGDPGVEVSGDIVTGGGQLTGLAAVLTAGVVDTSGADPRVATCAQALSDVRTASATLAGLTPTRDLGAVRAEPNGDYVVTLSADPGVNVWNATSLFAPTKHRFLGLNYTTIDVQLDPATESVIINVDRGVRVGTSSSITVSGGPPEKVVLNLVGGGTLNTDGYVDPRILAPESTVIVRVNGSVSGGAYARRVDVRGGYAF